MKAEQIYNENISSADDVLPLIITIDHAHYSLQPSRPKLSDFAARHQSSKKL